MNEEQKTAIDNLEEYYYHTEMEEYTDIGVLWELALATLHAFGRAPDRLPYPLNWRARNLDPQYEYRPAPEHGMGYFPVHKETGEVCPCEMEWDEKGEHLICIRCGLEGT